MNIKKKYLNLALPSGFECVIGLLVTMTDTLMISKFGTSTLASVGAMGAVIDFMYLVLQSINVSNNTLVARLFGKKDTETMKITTGNSLCIAFFCGLICIIGVVGVSSFLPGLFLVNKAGLIYLYIRLIGVIPNTILTILSGYQRTIGNSKQMLNVRILCFVLNAILDILFVVLGMGVMGVAVATVIVEIINMIYLIFCTKDMIKIKFVKEIGKEQFKLIKYNIYERIFKRGSNFVLNIIMSRIGAAQYAAHLIVMQFVDLINNFLHGIGIGTQTIIGTAIGSEDNKKTVQTISIVKNVNMKIIYISTLIISIAMLISLPFFLVEKDSLIIGYNLILFVVVDCILSGFYNHYSSILRAMKEFKYISILSLIISGFLRLVLAYFLSKVYGIYGVWICFIISDFVMNILLDKKIDKVSTEYQLY